MPKFIIIWNTGYGDDAEVVEAEGQEEADKEAYERWREVARGCGGLRRLFGTSVHCRTG